ncbi:MAG: hypothetical protein QNK42_09130 [Pseudodonghicola sp.]|nr:hypothetical protein [Pseudodonghicola sp.]
MSEAKALNVQFSLFPSAPGGPKADEIFSCVFGSDADETQSNKSVSPQRNFLSQAKSQSKGAVQSVRVLPGRVDIQISPEERVDGPDAFSTVDAAESLESLLSGIGNFPWDDSEYLRLAVVCNVVEREEDLSAANLKVANLSGLQAVCAESLDLMVQMNRRKRIAGDVEVNRVTQYSCLQIQTGQYHVVDGQLRPASVVEFFASSVNFDFNTVPGDFVFSSENVLPILSKIVELIRGAIKDLRLSSVLEFEEVK